MQEERALQPNNITFYYNDKWYDAKIFWCQAGKEINEGFAKNN